MSRSDPPAFGSGLHGLPDDWDVVPVTDLAERIPRSTTTGPFGSQLVASDYRREGVPVIFIRDITPNGFVWNSNVYVDSDKANELGAHSVRPGDVLVTKMGWPPCTACIYPRWMPPGVITADVIRLRPDAESVEPDWVALFVNSGAVADQVAAITAGGTRPKITLHDFRTLHVACPSREEQHKIVEILTAVDDLFEDTEALIAKYQAIKQGMMRDLFMSGIDSSGHLRPTHGKAPQLYKQSELGWIPEQWKVARLEDVTETMWVPDPLQPQCAESGVPFVSAKDLRSNLIDFSDCRLTTEETAARVSARCSPRRDDILIVSRGGSTGRVHRVTTDRKFVLNEGVIGVRPSHRCDAAYLEHFLRLPSLQAELIRASGSTGQAAIYLTHLKNVLVPVPTLEEQQCCGERLVALDTLISAESDHMQKLRLLKTGLMKDLLTGKVRVKVDGPVAWRSRDGAMMLEAGGEAETRPSFGRSRY